ncbi:MAG: hypothetical protein KGZ63_15410 [Clostridiales bacterium]|jgi:hypothetical protein|nr:hypothetical protein [Clostridiales bacterium]
MSKRKTKVIGFSVQPEMYEEILRYAQKENKSKSELFLTFFVLKTCCCKTRRLN